MDNIFPIYFNMFDEILRDKYDGKVTPEFKKLINEIKVKLKDTFMYDAKHVEYCSIIDENISKYLKDKQ